MQDLVGSADIPRAKVKKTAKRQWRCITNVKDLQRGFMLNGRGGYQIIKIFVVVKESWNLWYLWYASPPVLLVQGGVVWVWSRAGRRRGGPASSQQSAPRRLGKTLHVDPNSLLWHQELKESLPRLPGFAEALANSQSSVKKPERGRVEFPGFRGAAPAAPPKCQKH